MSSVYLRHDGRWECRIPLEKSDDGKRKYKAFFGKTREEAEKKMVDNLKEMGTNVSCITLSELFRSWHHKIVHQVKESTAANYLMKARKHILPYFGSKLLSEISSDDVYSFIDKKKKDGLSGRYINDIIILMKTIFKYAVRKLHMINPMDDVVLKKIKQEEVRLLDTDERSRLESYIWEKQDRTSLGIALALSTGIRIGELCALKWNDIDLEKRIMTVRYTVQRVQISDTQRRTKIIITEPKSESSKRSIPIPEFLLPILMKYHGKPIEYVVSGKVKPIEPRTMQYRFAKILRKTNLPPVHFHALRHMFATECIRLGLDVKTLSEILGHSSVEITLNRYVHSSFDQKREYMNRLKPAV